MVVLPYFRSLQSLSFVWISGLTSFSLDIGRNLVESLFLTNVSNIASLDFSHGSLRRLALELADNLGRELRLTHLRAIVNGCSALEELCLSGLTNSLVDYDDTQGFPGFFSPPKSLRLLSLTGRNCERCITSILQAFVAHKLPNVAVNHRTSARPPSQEDVEFRRIVDHLEPPLSVQIIGAVDAMSPSVVHSAWHTHATRDPHGSDSAVTIRVVDKRGFRRQICAPSANNFIVYAQDCPALLGAVAIQCNARTWDVALRSFHGHLLKFLCLETLVIEHRQLASQEHVTSHGGHTQTATALPGTLYHNGSISPCPALRTLVIYYPKRDELDRIAPASVDELVLGVTGPRTTPLERVQFIGLSPPTTLHGTSSLAKEVEFLPWRRGPLPL
ncbi:hypothetical protein EXIGLDRAFT_492838 [Exidia glandulosa HHB12029]|uniref:F-box domain-containing protein n=1 Tax=Exidia glandulosa HHB12029 TaxID=1314781 RepID=A0A165JM54_EXIGL|nr:hypothetical protein EXIGLDRAFT_492838 [Exidia glandulosa HHB12029]